jgi:hypothetical protein
MRRAWLALIAATCLVAAPAFSAPTTKATKPEAGDRSKNVKELTHFPLTIVKGETVTGTDFAFQGKTVVAGSYSGIGIYRIKKRAPYLKKLGALHCEGSQGDVSIWGHLVFMSVDSPRAGPKCTPKDFQPADESQSSTSTAWEGVRIIDISDPQQPKEIKAVYTDCGSHTHTLSPDGQTMYIYVQSYPLGAPAPNCNQSSHNKISVIKMPLDDPTAAEVVSTPSVAPAIGCHDVTVVPSKHIAVAACISESQVWDISDPANPTVLAHITNPEIQIHHSSGLTWDGKILALGDEFGGGGANGCDGMQDSTTAAMWFYDLTDPANPALVGHYALPRTAGPDESCTTHNFNIIPMNDAAKYIAAPAYYDGGLSVIDFSDPTAPKEIGHYQPVMKDGSHATMWSVYWYQGRLYENGEDGNLRVFTVKGLDKPATKYFKGRLNPQVWIPKFK